MAIDANSVWLRALRDTLECGSNITVRQHKTAELTNVLHKISMRKSVVTVEERHLNYKFMAAEAYWILSGSDKLADIAPFCKNITAFSDDGEKFFGAYGPKIMSQIDYVIETLVNDTSSRQAVINIWRENPPMTKDVPCTITMCPMIRRGVLNLNVNMRSSDLWLGFPYDVFNFSMLGVYILNALIEKGIDIGLGDLNLYVLSSHIYWKNLLDVANVLHNSVPTNWPYHVDLWKTTRNDLLLERLESLRFTG